MSLNTPGGNDTPPSRPPSGNAGDGAERPGFPPAGYENDRQAREGVEAASRDKEDPEAVLAALEAGKETPAQREARLGAFLDAHFADEVKPAAKKMAIKECQGFEDDCRDLFEEPDLRLGEEDATDPELKNKLVALSANVTDVVANDEAITAAIVERDEGLTTEATNAAVVAANTESINAERAKTAALEARAERRDTVDADRNNIRTQEKAKNAEVNRDLTTVKELQANFEELKAANDGSTIAALKLLLGEEGIKSPEMKAIVQRAVGTAEALVGAIPGKEEAIGRLLDKSGLTLGAATNAESFSAFLSAAEASDDFTDEDVAKLKEVITGQDTNEVKTGGDVNDVFKHGGGIETYVDADGNTQTREIPLKKGGEPVDIGGGHKVGIDEIGNNYALVNTAVGVYEIPLPNTLENDREMGNVIKSVQMRARMQENNAHEIFFPGRSVLQRGGGVLDYYPSDAVTTDKLGNLLAKDMTLAGNDLFTTEDLDQVSYYLQFFAQKGDARFADVNSQMVQAEFEAQGLISNGQLDWDAFSKQAMANRASYGHGEQRYEQTVEAA